MRNKQYLCYKKQLENDYVNDFFRFLQAVARRRNKGGKLLSDRLICVHMTDVSTFFEVSKATDKKLKEDISNLKVTLSSIALPSLLFSLCCLICFSC